MTMNTKKELFGIELCTYLKASKREKGEILDSLSRQTGMWRIEHAKLNPKILHDKLTKMKHDILQANRLTTSQS